jgi:hypothetical protein
MNHLKKMGTAIAVMATLYLLMPVLLFDFSSVAVPCDEENFGTHQVAIGPKPRWWVPGAARHLDIPGGFDYEPSGWTFVLWKPLCIVFDRAHGYAPPAQWR